MDSIPAYIADGSGITAAIATALMLAAAVLFFKPPRRTVVRKGGAPAVLSAGRASLGGDVLQRLVKFCHPIAQVQLAGVARGWHETVRIGASEMTVAEAREEAAALVFLADRYLDELIAAEVVQLSGCHLGAKEGRGVALLLGLSSAMRELHLRGNQLGDEGALHIAAALRYNASLKALYLDLNELGDEAAAAVASSLAVNRTLTFLTLASNGVGAEVHAAHEGEAFLGDEGAKALAASLEVNQTLRTLWLTANEIGDEGGLALASSLEHNAALTALDLRCNHVGDAAKEALNRVVDGRRRRGGAPLEIRVAEGPPEVRIAMSAPELLESPACWYTTRPKTVSAPRLGADVVPGAVDIVGRQVDRVRRDAHARPQVARVRVQAVVDLRVPEVDVEHARVCATGGRPRRWSPR
eukprot:4564569-Prymnesium_polylepis.1